MDGKTVESILETALAGSRQIVVTLKEEKEAKSCTTLLWTMNYMGRISLKNHDDIMEDVSKLSYKWGDEANRTFQMTLTKKFNKTFFAEQMHPGIEKIVVIG